MLDFEQVIGATPEAFCRALVRQRPTWVKGSLSEGDAHFLFTTVLAAQAEVAVEIGSASGFSACVLCHALASANQAGLISSRFSVASYDISKHLYFDSDKRVGDAARAQLSPDLLSHIRFRNPATALDVQDDYGKGEVQFLFIDGDHRHPWPTLDLLAILSCLRVGATVVLHDINLPILRPESSAWEARYLKRWGVKYLFDNINVEKNVPTSRTGKLANVGSIKIPEDKEEFARQLMDILFRFEWRGIVSPDYLARMGIKRQTRRRNVTTARLCDARLARIQSKPWMNKHIRLPEDIFPASSGLETQEMRMLHYLTTDEYAGKGVIANVGSFLDRPSICFAAALRERSLKEPLMHSYNVSESTHGGRSGYSFEVPEGHRARGPFLGLLRSYSDLITAFEGHVLEYAPVRPIEFLSINCTGSHVVWDHLLMNFFPALIPEHSLIILQDYVCDKTGPWHHIAMEKLKDYCAYVVDADCVSAIFLVTREMTRDMLETCKWKSMPNEERIQLMQAAIERLDTDDKKKILVSNLRILLQGWDPCLDTSGSPLINQA